MNNERTSFFKKDVIINLTHLIQKPDTMDYKRFKELGKLTTIKLDAGIKLSTECTIEDFIRSSIDPENWSDETLFEVYNMIKFNDEPNFWIIVNKEIKDAINEAHQYDDDEYVNITDMLEYTVGGLLGILVFEYLQDNQYLLV